MSWDSLGSIIKKGAPLLGSLVGGPLGGGIGSMIASLFGVEDDPEAIEAEIKKDPNAFIKLKKLENDHKEELIRLKIKAEAIRLENETKQQEEVNKTMRAEQRSKDRYKSYWRPSFGYAITFTWVAQTCFIGYVLYHCVNDPSHGASLIAATKDLLGALTVQWTVALSVVGVYVKKRSDDKVVVASGKEPRGLLGGIIGAIKSA